MSSDPKTIDERAPVRVCGSRTVAEAPARIHFRCTTIFDDRQVQLHPTGIGVGQFAVAMGSSGKDAEVAL